MSGEMSGPEDQGRYLGKWLAAVAVVLIALLAGVSVYLSGKGPGGAGLAGSRSYQVSTRPVTTTDAASKPASTATQRVESTQPGKVWIPPRTKVRQRERDAMARTMTVRYGLTDPAILAAMRAVPRHEFVSDRYKSSAYADHPLPIGHGQTISQPYIVAEMTRLLKLKAGSRALEIGTGSGYQAAVLTEFTRNVFTIEIIKPLAQAARKRLDRLGYYVVQVKAGDGYYGWPEKAPFDVIIVTAAAGQIPPPLIRQLARGGRMIIPVGGPFSPQSLTLVEKDDRGKLRVRSVMPVRFVPFVRKDVSEE